jgi:hypothetical protein
MMMAETENLLQYVREIASQDTGGGFICDVLILDDGRVLVISEEAIVLYKDLPTWEENPGEQEGVIYRAET